MKSVTICSSELPDLEISIKECINLGQWTLFKPDMSIVDKIDTAYYLITSINIFSLSVTGHIIDKMDRAQFNLRVDEIVYFYDLPKPLSLSNQKLN